MNMGPHGLGSLDGPYHFLSRPDPQILTNLFLEKGQHQVGQQEKCLFILYGLEEIRVLPSLLLGDGLISGLAEFEADGFRLFFLNNPLYQFSAFHGDMGRSNEEDFFIIKC